MPLDDLESRIWAYLGASPETIADWKARRAASVEDLKRKEAGGSWPFELSTENKMPDLTPAPGQEEPGFVEKSIGAIDPLLAAVAPFVAVNPLTGKKIEAKKDSPPAARRRPSTPPTKFSAQEMDKLTPDQRAKARDAASPSELRYELHTREQKAKDLQDQIGKPRLDEAQESASRGFMDAAISKAKLDKLVDRATPEQLQAAREYAQKHATAWRSKGYPWKKAYDQAFADGLRAGLSDKALDSMGPNKTQPRETPQAFTQKKDTSKPVSDSEAARILAEKSKAGEGWVENPTTGEVAKRWDEGKKPVTQAKNQAEVDAIHERMLAEEMTGPELDMSITFPRPYSGEETPAGPYRRALPPEPKGPYGAIDPATGEIIGSPKGSRAPERKYKDPIMDPFTSFITRRFMAKPEPKPKAEPKPEPKPERMTRAEWERRKAERERKNKK
jgi:hypothetical protein